MSMNMTAEKNAPAFDTSVTIAGVTLKNPVMTASGTFGSGAEYSEFVDLNKLGAVVTKGVANVPWPGNPTPRIAETHSGMLNAIGLQNPGIDLFCKRDIPYLKQFDTKIIVNVCGRSTEDYLEVVERLGNEPVDMLEINISCPNVKEGGIAFGQDPKAVEAITKAVKAKAKQPVIMKLSPNVTDITVMAKAAEAGGADRRRSGPPTGSTGIWQDNGAGNKAWLYDPLQRHRSKANPDRDLYRGGYKGYGSEICGEIWTGTGRAAGISNHQRHLRQSAAILWLSNREDAPSASE